jgi:hypothetical protein
MLEDRDVSFPITYRADVCVQRLAELCRRHAQTFSVDLPLGSADRDAFVGFVAADAQIFRVLLYG